jgi:hypothetical protein
MWWELYFWLFSPLVILGYAGMHSFPFKHVSMVIIGVGLTSLFLIGLFSFVYNKKILPQKFWTYFFWLNLVYFLLAVIYELSPTQPYTKYLSFLLDFKTQQSNITENTLFNVLFIPFFYAVFQLSKGKFRQPTKPREVRVAGTIAKKFEKLSRLKKIGIALGVLILIGVMFMAYTFWQAYKSAPALEQKLNAYLMYISSEDYKHAYELFSPAFKNTDDLDAFTNAVIYFRPTYEGYLPNSIQTRRVLYNHWFGQPSTITYDGIIMYQGGDTGEISAVFIANDEAWELLSVHIYAPPSRFDEFSPRQEQVNFKEQ